MRCEICGRGPADGETVFRQNPRGEDGIWRCGEHNTKPVSGDIRRVVGALDELFLPCRRDDDDLKSCNRLGRGCRRFSDVVERTDG